MNAIVLQCGGPTAVVNATLAAVVTASQVDTGSDRLWGARLGLEGLIRGDWVELTMLPTTICAQLAQQPGAALGSSRRVLADADLPLLLTNLAARQISQLYLIGGNGTMTVAHKLAHAARAAGYLVGNQPLGVIGIPKTVDNDLMDSDVAPGYASAARWIAQTVRDIGLDLRTMRTFDDVVVIELMGRHAGWLAAASALARRQADDPPDLILLPEVVFAEEQFLAAVAEVHQRKGICLVAASEGIRDEAGRFVAEKLGGAEADATGQKFLGLAPGVAPYLAGRVREQLKLRCRHLRPDTIQRSSSALVSVVDRSLAALVGEAAVTAARQGHSGVMVGLERQAESWRTRLVPLEAVMGRERLLPAAYYDPAHWDVTQPFLDYARPLAGQLALGAVAL